MHAVEKTCLYQNRICTRLFTFNLVRNSKFSQTLPLLCCTALDVSPPAKVFEKAQ